MWSLNYFRGNDILRENWLILFFSGFIIGCAWSYYMSKKGIK